MDFFFVQKSENAAKTTKKGEQQKIEINSHKMQSIK